MPQDFAFDFTFGGEEFEHVVLTWGLHRRRDRRQDAEVREQDWDWTRESWVPDPAERERGVGWTVDVPDVLRMLDQVRAGRATVDEARDMLLALTQESSKVSGCCVDCDNAADQYAEAVARCERARARFDDPSTYPYLVSQSAIHDWDCYHFTGRLPQGVGASLSDYVHNVLPGGPDSDLARLTADEAVAWMDARTGPKGGLRWRRCRSCQPALPGAWASESNDVPLGARAPRGR